MMHGKIIKFDYDWIVSKTDTERYSVCLTWAERQILLTLVDYIGWSTRWISPTGQTIDTDKIQAWRETITGELMSMCPVDCDDVIACVIAEIGGTATTLEDALRDWLREHGSTNPELYPADQDIPPVEGVTENLNIEGCDNNAMFGFTKQLVAFIDDLIQAFFNDIELASNKLELFDAVFDSVPVLTNVLQLVDYYIDSIVENYVAAFDSELENQIACDWFCIMVAPGSDCTFTWDDIITYLNQKLAYSLSDVNLEDWADFVVAGTWTGDEPVYIMFMTVAAVLSMGADWTGITLAYIQRAIAAFFNDPDPDWSTLCTQCYWTYTIDFTTEQGDWAVSTDFLNINQGTYVASTGWRTTWQNNGSGGDDSTRALCIAHPMSANSIINTVSVHYTNTNSGHWDGSGVFNHAFIRTPSLVFSEHSPVSLPNGAQGLSYTGDGVMEEQAEFVISLYSGRWYSDSDPGGQCTLTSITVSGVGDNPFD